MKRILLIDNTFDLPHGSPEIKAHLEGCAPAVGPVEITMVRGPESGIPEKLDGFDGAVLSGSKTRISETEPWIEKEMAAIRSLLSLKIPTLGICYGEQLIARTVGGETCTGVAPREEFGWVEIELKDTSALLAGLPRTFHTYEWHRDEVCSLPAGFRLTASSEACRIQAFDSTEFPVWGVQFHPERGLEGGKRSLEKRMKENPDFRPINHHRADEVFSAEVARLIFSNFLKQVWRVG